MKKPFTNKIIAMVMAAMMAVMSLPVTAFAAGNETEAPAASERSVQEAAESTGSNIQDADTDNSSQDEAAGNDAKDGSTEDDAQNTDTASGVNGADADGGAQDETAGNDAQDGSTVDNAQNTDTANKAPDTDTDIIVQDADSNAKDSATGNDAQDSGDVNDAQKKDAADDENVADADNAAQDSDVLNGAKNANGESATRDVTDDAIEVSSWDALYEACQKAPDNVSTTIVLSDNIKRPDSSDNKRIEIDEDKVIVLDLNGKTLDANREPLDPGTYNHVLDVHKGGNLTIKDSSGNNSGNIKGGCANNGGGIYISEGGTCRIDSGTINYNYAGEKGGGIYTEGTLIMTGGVLYGNGAYSYDDDEGRGGAIYCGGNNGKIQLKNVRIEYNRSGEYGAGIMIVLGNDDSYIEDCTITGNPGHEWITSSGGGLYVDADIVDRKLTINDTNITNNSGYRYGGGIYLKKGAIEMKDSSISNNVAFLDADAHADGKKAYGAGVYVDTNQARFIADSVTIDKNHFRYDGKGAGIYNNKGLVSLTNCTLTNNKAGEEGGGIYAAKNMGRLNLTDTEVTNNSAAVGGGVYFEDKGQVIEAMTVGGNTVVSDNVGSDVYLPGKMMINLGMNSPLGKGANIGITHPAGPGTFTQDFSRYVGENELPEDYFFSNDGYMVTKQDREGYLAVDLDEAHKFLKRSERVNTNVKTLGPANWMSGISGERYLNEINIPGTHDTAMNNVSSKGCLSGDIGAARAKTQKEYLFEQLDHGARFFDIRLKTYYCKDELSVGWLGYSAAAVVLCIPVVGQAAAAVVAVATTVAVYNGSALAVYRDDGENLWACHGRSAAGTFYALNDEDKNISFAQELEWFKEFLRNHPTETIIIDARPETDESDGETYYGPLERLKVILEEESTEINPSTNEPYIYWEDGIVGKKFEHWPQLKDVRGKIVFFGGKGEEISNTIGGFYKNTDGTVADSGKGGFKDAEKRGENIRDFLETQTKLQIPRDATHDQMKDFYWVKMNTTDPWQIETPVGLADKYVLPVVLGSNGLVNESQKGRYFGWFSMDAARMLQYRDVWITNFPDDLDYCTITVKSGPSGENAPLDQVYKVLRGSTITIPGCIYDGNQANYFKGWKADVDNETYIKNNKYEVLEDVVFTAQWANDIQTPVTVVWKDAENLDGIRPTQLEITYNGSYRETIKAEEDWSIMLSGDLTSDPSVNTITGYNAKVEGSKGKDGYTITMTHTPKISVYASGTVTWDDDNNKDGIRPASVTLKLYKNGGETPIASGTATAEGNWKFNLGTFPRYENGELVAYKLVEEEISYEEDKAYSGYTSSVEAIEAEKKAITGFEVTNTHEVTMAVMYAQIDWDDDDDAAGERPESVTVQWLKDGEPYGEPIVVNQDEENEGKWIVGLELTYAEIKALGQEQDAIAQKYKADEMTMEEFVEAIEKTISYSIRQDKIDNYTTTVTIKKIEGDDGEETGSYYQILNTYEKHEHGLTETKAKAATCTEDGNTAYWTCDQGDDPCGRYFSDEEATIEIVEGSWIIPATGHDWGEWVVTKEATETEEGRETRTCRNDPSHIQTRAIPAGIAYRNVFGDGNIWYKGSKDTSDFGFKRSLDDASTINHFTGILVDGETVDSADYTKESGSVIIKLKPEYLETLSLGEHTLTAQFDDGNGSASAKFTIAERKTDPEPTPKETSTPANKTDNVGVFHGTAVRKAGVPNTYDRGLGGFAVTFVSSLLISIASAYILRKY